MSVEKLYLSVDTLITRVVANESELRSFLGGELPAGHGRRKC